MSIFGDIAKIGLAVPTGGLSLVPGIEGKAKNLVDPGATDRAKAQKSQAQAIAEWNNLQGQIPGQASLNYGTDVTPYQTGPTLGTEKESYIDPMTAYEGFGIDPYSNFTGAESAYGDLGPSAWKSATSAYKSLAPSAAAGLGKDADYFRSVAKSGSDPIAEADYQKRAAQAEQSRKANTDAALAAQEAKGMGNAGGALSARIEGAQNAANDRYMAGVEAAGQAAQRRDTAAGTVANIDQAQAAAVDRYNQAKAAGLDEASARRASGLDAYNTNVAGGQDAFNANKNSALDAWANQRYSDVYGLQQRNTDRAQSADEANWNRINNVGDTNANNQTATAQFNKIQAPQDYFNNQMAVTAGKTGQYGGQSSLFQQQSQRDPWWKTPAQIGANVAKAAG